MTNTSIDSGVVSAPSFCALAYAPNSYHSESSVIGHVILLVIQEAEDALRFMIHPNLRDIVDAIDLPYIQSLLVDFLERVKLNATHLFRHLCSLAIGPLLTEAVGEQLSLYPEINKLTAQFIPLAEAVQPI